MLARSGPRRDFFFFGGVLCEALQPKSHVETLGFSKLLCSPNRIGAEELGCGGFVLSCCWNKRIRAGWFPWSSTWLRFWLYWGENIKRGKDFAPHIGYGAKAAPGAAPHVLSLLRAWG